MFSCELFPIRVSMVRANCFRFESPWYVRTVSDSSLHDTHVVASNSFSCRYRNSIFQGVSCDDKIRDGVVFSVKIRTLFTGNSM